MTGARPRLLVIVGPTASGKSRLAVEIAERLGGEIVGCDALQVYRGLDLGTAKPDARERARVPHHLIDHVDPRRAYSMAAFVGDAERAIGDIAGRGRVPVVAGGIGLYLRALLRGIIGAPARDRSLRARLERAERRHGLARLYRCLQRLDPDSARRLDAGDSQRIKRALEFALAGGDRWSERLAGEGTWAAGGERFASVKIGLAGERGEALRRQLDIRVRGFFAGGWVDEVRGLLASGVPPAANALKAIGYREIVEALATGSDPEASVEEIVRRTTRYVKRQRTWFRREPEVQWLEVAPDERAARAEELWRQGTV